MPRWHVFPLHYSRIPSLGRKGRGYREKERERERERESITFDGTTCSALSSFFLKRRPNSFHGSRPPPPPPSLWRIRIRYKAAKWSVGRGQRKAKGEEAPVHPGGAWADVERTWGAGRARGGGEGGGNLKVILTSERVAGAERGHRRIVTVL